MDCPCGTGVDHPLDDGIFVNDAKLVKFIQKVNTDFRPQAQINRRCLIKITEVYNIKFARAKALRKANKTRDNGTISTIAYSRASSISSLTDDSAMANRSQSLSNDSIDAIVSQTPVHEKLRRTENNRTSGRKNKNLTSPNDSTDAIVFQTPAHEKIRRTENNSRLDRIDELSTSTPARTLDNILSQTPQVPPTNIINIHNTILQRNNRGETAVNKSKDIINNENSILTVSPTVHDEEEEALVYPRLSQEPSTSKAASTSATSKVTVRKRTVRDFLIPIQKTKTNGDVQKDLPSASVTPPIAVPRDSQLSSSSVSVTPTSRHSANGIHVVADVDSEDDDPRLSLRAYDGTRLPHIVPHPPRRQPRPIQDNPSLMDLYSRDITGG